MPSVAGGLDRGQGKRGAPAGESFARELAGGLDCPVRATGAREALAGAHLVVTATRAATPLLPGQWVEPGAYVAAVGSSRPDTRELDDELLERSRACPCWNSAR